ncbi:MAG: (d)CMP kinase [Granulosicoccus sp.]|nr:(d)CMP kinase [Granulosicoccus sp.]
MSECPVIAPVIAIDGPSGAGKGTVSQRVAERLGFHVLDSGAVYRAAALQALIHHVDLTDETAVLAAVEAMSASFTPHHLGVTVCLDGEDVTSRLRSEQTAEAASRVAAMPSVRLSLLDEQRSFRIPPGLVADGRDMGSVVFPDAVLKVYLAASAEVRAQRRAKQLKEKGIEFTIDGLLQEIGARDERDSSREHSPLVATEGALIVDSSELSITSVVDQILAALPAELNAMLV